MHISVRASDDVPIYRQIMRQVIDALAGGQLVGGDRLMSHRELSEQLVIAPLTVKKAYDELETLGYIESHRGRGTFVAAKIPRSVHYAQTAHIADAAKRLLSQAYLAGLTLADVTKVLKHADRELTSGSSAGRRERASA